MGGDREQRLRVKGKELGECEKLFQVGEKPPTNSATVKGIRDGVLGRGEEGTVLNGGGGAWFQREITLSRGTFRGGSAQSTEELCSTQTRRKKKNRKKKKGGAKEVQRIAGCLGKGRGRVA